MKKSLLALPIILCVMTFAQANDAGPASISPQARAIHESAIVVDTHADTPQRFLDEGFDLATETNPHDGHEEFGKIQPGNLGPEFFSIWLAPSSNHRPFTKRTP